MTSSSQPDRTRLAAVILAGGRGVRLGGAEKASIEVGGETLLERALTATASAAEVVVVGPQVPVSRPVTWTREDPPGGGPAAGLLAGVDALLHRPDLVCALAVDMPRVTPSTLARLLDAALADADAGGAVLVDGRGRRQFLAGVYRFAALASARPARREDEHGLAMRRLLLPLRLVGVAEVGGEARDVDTWADLRDLRG